MSRQVARSLSTAQSSSGRPRSRAVAFSPPKRVERPPASTSPAAVRSAFGSDTANQTSIAIRRVRDRPSLLAGGKSNA